MTISRRAALAAMAAFGPIGSTAAHSAEAWPAKPIRLVVPWATGGFNDILGRLLADEMGRPLGQQVIVENRPGAAGTLGSENIAQSPPDGYSLLLATADTHAIAKAVYPQLRYDPVRDFTPVSFLVSQPVLLWVSSDSGIKDLAGFIARAKAQPGKTTYASNGVGSATHLGMESFARSAGIEMLHVPYKGTGPALIDLLGNRLDTMFLSVQAAGQHGSSGKLRPLAISSGRRSPAFPEVPTFAEAGQPFQLSLWQGLMAPRNTPADIVDRLARESARALNTKAIRERMESLGVDVVAGNPAAFRQTLVTEVAQWQRTVKALNLKLD